MKDKLWRNYWVGIISIQVIIQLFHTYNFITQPDMGDYYTGKSVVYSLVVFGAVFLIFTWVNVYALVICIKEKKLRKWVTSFLSCIVFLFLSELIFNAIAERFMPLDVWEQSTLKKLQLNKTQ